MAYDMQHVTEREYCCSWFQNFQCPDNHMEGHPAEMSISHPMQGPNAVWTEKECASTLLQHLQLGFELDLYAPEEFCMLFW